MFLELFFHKNLSGYPNLTGLLNLWTKHDIHLHNPIAVRKFANNEQEMEVYIFKEDQKKLARYAKALGHPVRVYVLNLLSEKACCYSGDLSDELPIAKSTLSQHLKELKDAGLIQGEIEAPRIKYCINKESWEEAKRLFTDFYKE